MGSGAQAVLEAWVISAIGYNEFNFVFYERADICLEDISLNYTISNSCKTVNVQVLKYDKTGLILQSELQTIWDSLLTRFLLITGSSILTLVSRKESTWPNSRKLC
jgi:hypothetical protein